MNHLAKMLRSYREKNQKRLSDLAVMIGYKNVNKGIRRLSHIEKNPSRYNAEDMKIVHKIMEVFNIPQRVFDVAIDEDARESVVRANNVFTYRGNPYVIIRFAPAFYLQYDIPKDLYSNYILMEEYACRLAKDKHVYICLVLPNKYEIWIDKNGEVYSRSEFNSEDNFKPVIY